MEKDGNEEMILWMLLGYSILLGVLSATVLRPQWKKYYITAKSAASLGFLAVFFLAARESGDLQQLWLMLPAFVCCFAGDVLMGFYNRCRRRIHFMLGLLIFLIGHICFVRWLGHAQSMSAIDFVFPAAAVVVALMITARKDIHTGRLRPFIMIYTFFVALFFSKGIHLAAADPATGNLVTAVGCGLFLVSDTSILFLYFHRKKGWGIHIFNLGTYYVGMFLLAVSPML